MSTWLIKHAIPAHLREGRDYLKEGPGRSHTYVEDPRDATVYPSYDNAKAYCINAIEEPEDYYTALANFEHATRHLRTLELLLCAFVLQPPAAR